MFDLVNFSGINAWFSQKYRYWIWKRQLLRNYSICRLKRHGLSGEFFFTMNHFDMDGLWIIYRLVLNMLLLYSTSSEKQYVHEIIHTKPFDILQNEMVMCSLKKLLDWRVYVKSMEITVRTLLKNLSWTAKIYTKIMVWLVDLLTKTILEWEW